MGSDPATDLDALVDRVDYPLYVVTAADATEVSGCLAGFVTQSSIRPSRFIVCISKQNHTFRVAEQAAGLAVHLLGTDQHDLASLFGEQSGDVMDKFDHVHWRRGATGAPILADCSAWIEGHILWRTTAGDHEAFLVAVEDGGAGPRHGQLDRQAAGDLQAGHPATDAATVETVVGPHGPEVQETDLL
ncbi:MAG TPA: flavin reductase family protein [Acidimicrobiales bacterium]|jgi:flavin reductase (DIM6/NTAB) family NADH-FMN oxidoreductase RutF